MYYQRVECRCSSCGALVANQMKSGDIACSQCGTPFTGMCSRCKHVATYAAFSTGNSCPKCGSAYFIYASSSDIEEARKEAELKSQRAQRDAEKAARRAAKAADQSTKPGAHWWSGGRT